MYRWFYSFSELLHLPIFTMLLFITVFSLVVARVMRMRAADSTDALARLPLQDPPTVSNGGHHV